MPNPAPIENNEVEKNITIKSAVVVWLVRKQLKRMAEVNLFFK